MIGKSVSHYEIHERIGAGGMGVVYRAEDSRLGCPVALKFLPNEVSEDEPQLERFLQEARAASSLNHPNICTVHDIGEYEGSPFIVMELLDGQSLRERIGEGPLDLDSILNIALQISDALDVAHAKGIVHRDIKPDNLFVGKNDHAKILDFGLAKLTQSEPRVVRSTDPTRLQEGPVTRSGSTLGTVAYMSPEQALGKDVDARTDVFSLGAVLCEMGTGERAFPGDTEAAVFDRILNENPELDKISKVSTDLHRIVGKALEKDRDLRYQSAAELRADLKRLQRDTLTGEHARQPRVESEDRRAVVVLPFKLLSGGDEYEFLSLALAEAVSHDLSSVRDLEVRPTSAVMRYANVESDPMQVARELNVSVVVEGSIQRLGSHVRVQVQAWDAPGGSTILSVKLDGDLDDLFGLQDRVAETLSRGLGVRSEDPAAEPPTLNPRAYEQYLRASECLLRWTHGDTIRAIEMLRSAVALDPGFSDGWGRLSGALAGMGALYDPADAWFEEAGEAIEKALALDPENPHAWTARGRILWSSHQGFQNRDALRDLTQACGHPAHPYDAPLWRSVVLTHVGLHEEALSIVDEALDIQPDDVLALIVKGETLGWMGDAESFLEFMERCIALDPASPFGRLLHPIPLVYLDRPEKAESAIRSAKRVFGEDALLISLEALLWAKRGEHETARPLLEAALEDQKSISHAHHTYHYAAAAYATLGESSRAVEVLDRATQTGMPNYSAFSIDPHFESLGDRSDFKALMKRVKVGWESLRAEFGGNR